VDPVTVRLVVRGRVQGVGFRWWVRETAERLGLEGWVRNRRDGAVELVASGPSEAVARLAEACWQGPAGAAVLSVDRRAAQAERFAGFEQRATL
jgi:acylphosphatase